MEYYCGHYAREKKLHPHLLTLPVEKQTVLLDTYFRGDGNTHRDHRGNRADTVVLSTASRKLAFQLQMIVARLGYFAKVRDRVPAPSRIEGRAIRNNLQYTVTYAQNPSFRSVVKRGDGVFYIPIGKIDQEFHDGEVYNLMVNSRNPSYLVNGFVVHNCASAIAATSMFSVMVTENDGMPIADALGVRPQHIMLRLGGLPNRKIHCSVLADNAFPKAANDYFHQTGQHGRVIVEGAKVVDPKLNITDHDIEEAVLEGATDLDAVQQKLKVGIGSPEIITEVEQLIRFYKEKYYG